MIHSAWLGSEGIGLLGHRLITPNPLIDRNHDQRFQFLHKTTSSFSLPSSTLGLISPTSQNPRQQTEPSRLLTV